AGDEDGAVAVVLHRLSSVGRGAIRFSVIPAKAGIQTPLWSLDSRLRGNDGFFGTAVNSSRSL
ncbi:MAG TPA: hypothetical protein VK971_02670, partial [Thiohalobacter sp.]|nr:hypothetical protein [Thiohalobacter sp.]